MATTQRNPFLKKEPSWFRKTIPLPDFLEACYGLKPATPPSRNNAQYHCPFGHQDLKPSFNICKDPQNRHYNRFKCFSAGCEEYGDIIDFVQWYDPVIGKRALPLPFREALSIIAGELLQHTELSPESGSPEGGFIVERVIRATTKESSGRLQGSYESNARSGLGQRILKETVAFYESFFSNESVQHLREALRYRKEIGGPPRAWNAWQHLTSYKKFSPQTIREFQLGFGGSGLYEYLKRVLGRKAGLPFEEFLFRLKLVSTRGSAIRETHAGRIIFPVIDEENRIVGLLSRHHKAEARRGVMRYRADFQSSKVLYGLNRWIALPEAARRTVFLTESVTDFLALYDRGVQECVSTFGASFSSHHARLFEEVLIPMGLEDVYVCYDQDEGGHNGSGDVYARLGHTNLRVHRGLLPDSVTRLVGKEQRKKKEKIKDIGDLVRFGGSDSKSLRKFLMALSDGDPEPFRDFLIRFSTESFFNDRDLLCEMGVSPHRIAARMEARVLNHDARVVELPREGLIEFLENGPFRKVLFLRFAEENAGVALEKAEPIVRIPLWFLDAVKTGHLKKEVALFLYLKAKQVSAKAVVNFRNSTLCEALSISERALQRHKKLLVERGMLFVRSDRGKPTAKRRPKRAICRYIPYFRPLMQRWPR